MFLRNVVISSTDYTTLYPGTLKDDRFTVSSHFLGLIFSLSSSFLLLIMYSMSSHNVMVPTRNQ
jgi:hypothetical protein